MSKNFETRQEALDYLMDIFSEKLMSGCFDFHLALTTNQTFYMMWTENTGKKSAEYVRYDHE